MASSKIILKKSSVVGKIPQPADLEYGELALNYADGIIYYKDTNNTIQQIAGGTGGTVLNALTLDGYDSSLTATPDTVVVRDAQAYIEIAGLNIPTGDTNAPTSAISWNSVYGTLNISLLNGVTLQAGQELHIHGKAVGDISNRDVVMFAGAQGDHLLFTKADGETLGFQDKWIVGIATQDIANNGFGYITWFGKVNDVDTNSWAPGTILYFDPTVPGGLTDVLPTTHKVTMAAVIKQSTAPGAMNGVLMVRPDFGYHLGELHDVSITDPQQGHILLFDEASGTWYNDPGTGINAGQLNGHTSDYFMFRFEGEPNGFPNRDQVILSFNNTTRIFRVDAKTPYTSYDYWANGQVFNRSSASVTIDDTEGQWHIYFDSDGQLKASQSFTTDYIQKLCYVANLYWDATNNKVVPFVENELHGIEMSAEVHSYLHRAFGTQYINGLDITLVADGDGSSNTHCQFSGTAGVIVDEDITHLILPKNTTDTIPVLYMLNAYNWRMESVQTSYPVVPFGAGRPSYNFFNGSTWSLQEVGEGKYTLSHIFAIPGTNPDEGRYVAVMGQSQYDTLIDAQNGAREELLNIRLGARVVQEYLPVATLLIQASSSYTNAVKARIVSTANEEDFVDWRFSSLSVTASAGAGGSGYSGYSGISGTSGYSGTSGTSGYSGTSGTSGYSGASGISGYSGFSGDSGYSGRSGYSGFSGVSGYSGRSGYSGFSGVSGYSGASGASGYSGFSGVSGYSGASGKSGYSGFSGVSGYSGASGKSGYSGFSGVSGYSGFSGISGATGASITYKGVYATLAALKAATNTTIFPVVGDAYLVEADGHLYIYNGNVDPQLAWNDGGQFKGDTGDSGFSGVSGYSGFSGVSGYSGFSGISGSITTWLRKTNNYTALSGEHIIADTTGGAFTITLPATPALGNFVAIVDGNDWSITSLIVGRNGSTIEGIASDYVLNTPGIRVDFIFDGTTWELYRSIGQSGYSGVSGYSGFSGVSGYSGFSGVSGYSGFSGVSGYSGKSGYSGVSGYSAPSGYSGYSGRSGYSGLSGYSGFSGDSGISGYSGLNGTIGQDGDSGYSGYSGSGVSGYSGDSGYSGYSGEHAAYTNGTPTTSTLGGIAAGSTFLNKTMTEMFDMLLYPYQNPAFNSFTISGQSTPIEVGTTISGAKTFTWNTTNSSNVATNSILIQNITGGTTTIASGLADDGTESGLNVGTVQKTSATTHTWRITGTNTQAANFTRDYTVTWQWRRFYGESTEPGPLTEAQIEALRVNGLSSGFAATYSFNAGGYKYLAYASALGTATAFKDQSNNLDVPFEPYYTVDITNANGITTTYKVHRTTNILGASINIIVS